MSMMLQDDRSRADAFERAMHRTLTATEGYARKIHWWVRFFGICLVGSLVLSFLAGMMLIGSLTR